MTATTLDLVAELLTPDLRGAACLNQARVMDLPRAGASTEAVAAAREVCDSCPVLVYERCRMWAIGVLNDVTDPGGMLAGLTEIQRNRLRAGEALSQVAGDDSVPGKTCPTCTRWRPLIAFYKRPDTPSRLTYQCATCHKAGQKRTKVVPPEVQCGRCRLNLPPVAFGRGKAQNAVVGICLNCRT